MFHTWWFSRLLGYWDFRFQGIAHVKAIFKRYLIDDIAWGLFYETDWLEVNTPTNLFKFSPKEASRCLFFFFCLVAATGGKMPAKQLKTMYLHTQGKYIICSLISTEKVELSASSPRLSISHAGRSNIREQPTCQLYSKTFLTGEFRCCWPSGCLSFTLTIY